MGFRFTCRKCVQKMQSVEMCVCVCVREREISREKAPDMEEVFN